MKNKIILAILAVLLVIIVGYSGFWFFRAHAIKTKIDEQILKSEGKWSAESVKVSGFPMAHRISVSNLKSQKFHDKEVVFENIEIVKTDFSDTFELKFPGGIILKDEAAKQAYNLELSPDTVIKSIASGDKDLLIKYTGSGYKILDQESKKLIIENQTKNSEMEIGFGDVVFVKSKSNGGKTLDGNGNIVASSGPAHLDISLAKNGEKSVLKFDVKIQDIEYGDLTGLAMLFTDKNPAVNVPKNSVLNSDKTTFTALGEATIVSNGDKTVDLLPSEQMAQLPEQSKALYRKKASPYSVALNLQNFDFSTQLYQLSISAQVNTYAEDSLPSGVITLKIDNFPNLNNQITAGMQQYVASKSDKLQEVEENQEFLNKWVGVIKLIAAKNPKTTESNMVFDFKREKNGGFNFLINDATFAEIVAQTMQIDANHGQNNQPNPIRNLPAIPLSKTQAH